MKQSLTPHRRAVASLLCATALFAIPAFAQDAQTAAPQATAPQTVSPPPVVPTVSAPPAQAQAAAPAASNPKGIGDPNSATPIAPEALQSAEESQAANRAATAKTHKPVVSQRSTVTHTTTSKQASTTEKTAPAPAAAPAEQTPASAPVAATPPVAQPAPQPAPAANPAPATADQSGVSSTTTAVTTTQRNVMLPWIIGGIVVLLGIIALVVMRRRGSDRFSEYEPAYTAPVAEPVVERAPEPVAAVTVAEPEPEPARFVPAAAAIDRDPVTTEEPSVIEEAVAAPAAPEAVEVAQPEAAEVASLTGGDAPVADRPWLELAMRPLRAGTNVDEALVEIELTVGNAGNIPAEDVRISTFMLSADPGSASEMEKLLVQHREDAAVPVDTIAPGEGKRIDATLALLKSEFVAPEDAREAAFQPMVVADARYRLPDGSEGRTSASFLIGLHSEEGEGFEPFSLARPEMHEDVEARLAREPVHA